MSQKFIVQKLLKSFDDRKKVNALIRYLQAPIINQTKDIVNLVKYYAQFYPEIEDPNCYNSEYIAQELFSKHSNPKKRFDNITARASPLVKQFIIQEELKDKRQEHKSDLLFLKAIATSRTPELFFDLFKEKENALLGDGQLGIEKHFQLLELYTLYYQHPNLDREQDTAVDVFKNINEQANLHFLNLKLKTACENALHKHLKTGYAFEIDGLKEVKNYVSVLQRYYPHQYIIIKLYKDILILLEKLELLSQKKQGKTAGYVNQYKGIIKNLEENTQHIPQKEHEVIFSLLLNIGSIMSNEKMEGALFVLLDIYKYGLAQELMLHEGYLQPPLYNNIITIALMARDLTWIQENMVDKYLKYIHEDERKNVENLTLASLAFENEEYNDAIKQLQELDKKEYIYSIRIKNILLKSYYEVDDVSFDKILTNYKSYLKRHEEIAQIYRDSNMNFIQLTQKLYHKKGTLTGYRKAEKQAIKDDFLKELAGFGKVISNEDWLIEKINQL